MPPLKGVVHSVGVLDDGILLQQSPARFQAMAGKVDGAYHLHRLTRERRLDFFILYSSAASLLGSPGQGNYAAANAFLDALAHQRQAEGLPALSINWGPWAEVGLAARPDRGGRLSLRGFESLTPAQGAQALDKLVKMGVPQVAAMPINLRQWRQFSPQVAQMPLLSDLAGEESSSAREGGGSDLKRQLLAVEVGPERRAVLEGYLREQIARVLRLSPGRIASTTPLGSLGFDSLMTLELRNRLETAMGLNLPATLIYSYPTLEALAGHLAKKMELPLDTEAVPSSSQPEAASTPPAAEGTSPSTPPDVLTQVDQLSDEDVRRLLAGNER